MQLRELLNNKQVLNPLVEIKNVSQNSSLDVFNQILTKKNETMTKLESNKASMSEKTQNTQNEYEQKEVKFKAKSLVDVKINLKSAADVGVSKTSSEKVDNKSDNKLETKSSPKAEKTTDDVDKEAKSTLTEKLKQKLKKETGLNDQQLDQLLASMNLDVPALQKLLAGGPGLGEMLKAVGDILDTLEIDTALSQDLTPKDVSQVIKQLNKVVETLEKMSKELPSTDKSESKSFESQLIQKLSQVISSLENSDNQVLVKPQELTQNVLAAISTSESNIKTAEPGDETPKEVTTDLSVGKAITAVNSNNTTDSKTTDSKSENDASQSKPNTVQDSVTPQTIVAKAPQSVVADASVEVKTDVKVVEDSNGISVHQVTMKNGNFVTTQATTVVPVMKQEIMTQIMDAIKGQIKLSDQGTSMIVKLQPEQLGNVELKLNIQKGVVLAELKVENEIVKAAIESNLDDLKQSLNNKGYAIDQISVSVDSGKKEGQEAFDFQGREQNNKSKNDNRHEGSLDIEPLEQISRYELNELEGSTFSYYG